MNFIKLITLTLLLSNSLLTNFSHATIISKKEVAEAFTKVVIECEEKARGGTPSDSHCGNIHSNFILDTRSVNVSLAENPLTLAGEFERGADYYEVHANFLNLKSTKKNDWWHLNVTLVIYGRDYYFGKNDPGVYYYGLRVARDIRIMFGGLMGAGQIGKIKNLHFTRVADGYSSVRLTLGDLETGWDVRKEE